jgi:Lrp/AsnC family leucine-responsive transcriptional regulator
VSLRHSKESGEFEREIGQLEGVLDCHHVTGGYSLMLKVKTDNTSSLEQLISQIHSIAGVDHTETMVVLSTHTERTQIHLPLEDAPPGRRVHHIDEGPVTRLRGI